MSQSSYVNNAIFWVELEKISPNPYQPRREFDEDKLKDLAESIRMYGVLQPLVVTRKEVYREDGGMHVEYELISGERRLRASKLAGLSQVPVLIRSGEESSQLKLEMAIIENLQREDLNPVDRARSFKRLADEFKLKQAEIADKVGKSREYVSNSMRILSLPEEMIIALESGNISEGHTRPLLMLADRQEEQVVLFKEIMAKKLTVREAESLSRRVATDRIRNKTKYLDPAIIEMEKNFTESLGTRVRIEKGKEQGGTVTIDFFSPEDLRVLLEKLNQSGNPNSKFQAPRLREATAGEAISKQIPNSNIQIPNQAPINVGQSSITADQQPSTNNQQPAIDDRSPVEAEKDDNQEIYSLKNFSL